MKLNVSIIICAIFLSGNILAQELSDSLSTIKIHKSSQARNKSTSTTFYNSGLKEGFNQIFAVEDGLLISEGVMKQINGYSFKSVFGKRPIKRLVRTGLWTLYEEDRVKGSISYDSKGNILGETYYHSNGKIKESRYRESRKSPWIIENSFNTNEMSKD